MRKSEHGYSRTKVYIAWQNAKDRCHNQNHPEYERYGAKGIYVSEEFRNDPKAWCDYLGHPPDNTPRKWSVDRIDASKGYERGNLRWATADIQARNQKKRKNNTSGTTGVSFYTRNGNTYCIAWWEQDDSVNAKSKCFSVNKYGLLESFAKAVTFRRTKLAELTALGYGYSDKHGE